MPNHFLPLDLDLDSDTSFEGSKDSLLYTSALCKKLNSFPEFFFKGKSYDFAKVSPIDNSYICIYRKGLNSIDTNFERVEKPLVAKFFDSKNREIKVKKVKLTVVFS